MEDMNYIKGIETMTSYPKGYEGDDNDPRDPRVQVSCHMYRHRSELTLLLKGALPDIPKMYI